MITAGYIHSSVTSVFKEDFISSWLVIVKWEDFDLISFTCKNLISVVYPNIQSSEQQLQDISFVHLKTYFVENISGSVRVVGCL